MKTRRLALGAFTVVSCSPAGAIDAGYDAGTSGGDAGTADAGGATDAGCICRRSDGGCPVPSDFPPDASAEVAMEFCYCSANDTYFCHDETTVRCGNSWLCYPLRATDGGGGVELTDDGGTACFC